MFEFLKTVPNWLRERLKRAWQRIHDSEPAKIFLKPTVIVVFVLVALWNLLISGGKFLDIEVDPSHPFLKGFVATLRDVRDVNLHLQMRLYQPIAWRAIPLKNENVRLVYIDDDAHWNDMYGNTPTDRKQLAKLITHAAQWRTKASVIGLDVELLKPANPNGDDPRRTEPPSDQASSCQCGPKKPKPKPTSKARQPASKPPRPPLNPLHAVGCMGQNGYEPGTIQIPLQYALDCDTPDLSLFSDNDALFEALKFAAKHRVPVILAGYLYHERGEKESAPRHQLDNLYSPDELYHSLVDLYPSGCSGPRCTSYGYINLPVDSRQVPLVSAVTDQGVRGTADSFAYKVAKALKDSESILTDEDDARPGRDLFGTFLSEDNFASKSIDFRELANGKPEALSACQTHVVLIGGRWRGEEGRGAPVDQHLSPAGEISGVALHATYIEALLAHQISREWSFTTNFILDVILGLVIFGIFAWMEGKEEKAANKKKARIVMWVALGAGMLSTVGIAWLSIGLFNKYLDFLFPVELYFLHILVEMWEGRHRRKHPSHDSGQAVDSTA